MARSTNPHSVDREKICPFLVRVFVRAGAQHDPDRDFRNDHVPTSEESHLYTWKDATLRELCLNLIDSNPTLKPTANTKFNFNLIYVDTTTASASQQGPTFTSRNLGVVYARDLSLPLESVTPRGGGLKNLDDCRFLVGDYLSVAVLSGQPGTGGPTSIQSGGPRRSLVNSAPHNVAKPINSGRPGAVGFGIRGRGVPLPSQPVGGDRPTNRGAFVHPSRAAVVPSNNDHHHQLRNVGADSDRWGHVTDTDRPRKENGRDARDRDTGGGSYKRRRESRSRSPPRRRW